MQLTHQFYRHFQYTLIKDPQPTRQQLTGPSTIYCTQETWLLTLCDDKTF